MRPRKIPPVPVPDGSKFCFKCKLVLPAAAFAKDAKQHDGKRMNCRRCDSAATYARQKRRRERLRGLGPVLEALGAEPLPFAAYHDRYARSVRQMRLAAGMNR